MHGRTSRRIQVRERDKHVTFTEPFYLQQIFFTGPLLSTSGRPQCSHRKGTFSLVSDSPRLSPPLYLVLQAYGPVRGGAERPSLGLADVLRGHDRHALRTRRSPPPTVQVATPTQCSLAWEKKRGLRCLSLPWVAHLLWRKGLHLLCAPAAPARWRPLGLSCRPVSLCGRVQGDALP